MADRPLDTNYKALWAVRRTRWAVVFCLAFLPVIFFYLPWFYQHVIGPKPGILLEDPVLRLFVPVNWSVLIFSIIYASILQTVFMAWRRPLVFLTGLTTYFLITLFRMLAMYWLTLEPPPDMILLQDPITAHFYPDSAFAKDLFFSGHVSTMTLLTLMEQQKWMRWLKAMGTVTVGIMLMWQHVHYALDVGVAPILTFLLYFYVRNRLSSRPLEAPPAGRPGNL